MHNHLTFCSLGIMQKQHYCLPSSTGMIMQTHDMNGIVHAVLKSSYFNYYAIVIVVVFPRMFLLILKQVYANMMTIAKIAQKKVQLLQDCLSSRDLCTQHVQTQKRIFSNAKANNLFITYKDRIINKNMYSKFKFNFINYS